MHKHNNKILNKPRSYTQTKKATYIYEYKICNHSEPDSCIVATHYKGGTIAVIITFADSYAVKINFNVDFLVL